MATVSPAPPQGYGQPCKACSYIGTDPAFKEPACTCPDVAQHFDPVEGWQASAVRCREARSDQGLCGKGAAFFVAA